MHKIETSRAGGAGLPNGMLVMAGQGLNIDADGWEGVKDHPVVAAMVADGTLVVDRKASKSKGEDRDENGDTAEMATMRSRFDDAYRALNDKLTTATGENTALNDKVAGLELEVEDLTKKLAALAPATPEAKHRGAGSYSIMEGDAELREKLTKDQAEAFNVMDDAGKTKWLAENPKAA